MVSTTQDLFRETPNYREFMTIRKCRRLKLVRCQHLFYLLFKHQTFRSFGYCNIMPRKSDIAYSLPSERISLETWSADFTNYTIEDKIIKTTLKNTVLDIKEVISKRSADAGGKLNPKAIQLKNRNQVYEDHQQLNDFLVQETEHTRIQVLIDLEKLADIDHIPSLMNINLKLSTGKQILLRESLNTTISSIKYALVEDLKLNGSQDIITLEYNAGQELQDRNDLQIGQLLELDTVPVDDLNIYVRLKDDFVVKLSSPNENILRIQKVIVCSETSITTIKRFIADQYKGTNEIDIPDIKIIYFGRILSNESKLNEILNGGGDSSVNSLITLHFVISDPQPQTVNRGGFWSDLTSGNSLFEFLPLEPNPNFEADLERDRRLRERLAGNLVEEEIQPQDPLEGSSIQQQQQDEPVEEPAEFNNSAPALVNVKLSGESYDKGIKDGEEVYLSQTDTSTTVYQVTLNTANGPRQIILSSSQAIINNSDASHPYIMLSPSGFAKLETLGIDIQKPNVILGADTAPFPLPHLTAAPNLSNSQQATQTQAQTVSATQRQHRGSIAAQNRAIVNVRRFSIRINQASVTRGFQLAGRLGYHLGKIYLFYSLIISQIPDNFNRMFCLVLLGVYTFTNGSIRNLLHEVQLLLPQSYRDFTSRYIEAPERFIRSSITSGSSVLMRDILHCLPDRAAVNIFEFLDNFLRRFVVSVILFFTSLFPALHGSFLEQREIIAQERLRREQVMEQLRRETQEPMEQNERVSGSLEERPDTQINDEAELLRDDPDNGATGVQVHHEN